MKKTKKIKNPEHISSFYKAEIGTLVLISIFGIIYNVGMLANPVFQGTLLDLIQLENFRNDISILYKTIFVYFATIVFVQVIRMLKRFFTRKFAYDTSFNMRRIVYNNILNQTENELTNQKIGTLISRVTSDIDKAVEGMRKLVTEIFDTVLLFVVYLIYLFCFDIKITLLSVISVILGILLSFAFRKLNFKYSSLARKENAKLSSKTFDLFDHALLYRINGCDTENLNEYDKTLGDYEKYNFLSLFVTDTMIPLSTIVALIGLIPLVFIGTGYVLESKSLSFVILGSGQNVWTSGVFVNYLTAFVLLCNKTGHTAKLFSSVQSGIASWRRIQPYIHEYKDYPKGTESYSSSQALVFHEYSLNVFGRNLIQGLNLTMDKGQIIGITGVISSGKTALAKSLMKYIPYGGNVLLFGRKLSSYSSEDIAKNISYMGHKSHLFTDTIKNNISLGDDKDVLPYLKAVSFYADMECMPERENSIVGNEGVRLSGGQQQRIALARTLYHERNIVILDDPFSNVDQKTEYEIMSNLNKWKEKSLVILISHRLSSFKTLDGILVLHGDSTFDYGTHEELLERNSVYRKLWQMQVEAKEVEYEK